MQSPLIFLAGPLSAVRLGCQPLDWRVYTKLSPSAADTLRARDTRDERLSVLFRRWPSLTKIEMNEIRRLHDERQRLARHVGMLRQRQRAASGGT